MSDPNALVPARRCWHALGTLCVEGKQLAEYLWQVPDDGAARQQIFVILDQIAAEGAKQGRKEMPRLCAELRHGGQSNTQSAAGRSSGERFDRLYQLWQAAKSGLL
jgi:hypothetical protein